MPVPHRILHVVQNTVCESAVRPRSSCDRCEGPSQTVHGPELCHENEYSFTPFPIHHPSVLRRPCFLPGYPLQLLRWRLVVRNDHDPHSRADLKRGQLHHHRLPRRLAYRRLSERISSRHRRVHGWAPLVATQANFPITQALIAYPGAPALFCCNRSGRHRSLQPRPAPRLAAPTPPAR
jgi:hypothetical protein